MSELTVKLYRDDKGEWRWTARAGNGEPLAVSSEGYEHRTDCADAAHQVVGGMTQGMVRPHERHVTWEYGDD